MKLTLKLTFIYFKEQLFGMFGGLSKKSRSKSLAGMMLLLAILAAVLTYSLYNMADTFNKIGRPETILILGLLLATFMAFMITINDTQGTMYKSRDYDMLTSLPIRSASIITAKYLSTYLVSTLYYCLVALPTFIVFFIFNKVTAFGVILGILSIVFMPALGQLVSCMIGWLVNIISSKMKNKNIVRTLLSVVLAVGLAVFMSLSNNNMLGTFFSDGTPLWFNIIFSNIYFLFKSITSQSFLYYLAAIGVSVGYIVLGILLISIGYKKINSSLNTTVKGKAKPITYSQKSAFAGLFNKEVATLFNSPVYCVNALMGIIMSVVIMVMSITMYYQIAAIPEVANVMTAMMAFGCAMCAGIAPTTAVSVSMEGTKLQTLKSLPVKYTDIMFAKCALNLSLSVPVLVVCAIIFGSVIKIGVPLTILIILYLIVSSVAQTVLGLLLNLKFPRLNWTSETQAAKSGASMLTTMALDMLLTLAPMVIFFVMYFNLPWVTITGFIGVSLGLQAIYAITLVILLFKKGESIYNQIQV